MKNEIPTAGNIWEAGPTASPEQIAGLMPNGNIVKYDCEKNGCKDPEITVKTIPQKSKRFMCPAPEYCEIITERLKPYLG